MRTDNAQSMPRQYWYCVFVSDSDEILYFTQKFTFYSQLNSFSLPENIRRQICTKISLLRDGRINSPDAMPDSIFAQQIETQEYNRQKTEGTNVEVLKQIQNVRNMPNLSNARKEEIIRSLQSQHPSVVGGVSLV